MKGDYMSNDDTTVVDHDGGQTEPQVEVQPEMVTQEEQMPSSDQEVPAVEPEVEGSLPEDANERTRTQFEKLVESNKKLKAELEEKSRREEYGNSVFESLKKSQQPRETRVDDQPIADQFIDSEGNVDINAINKALLEANRRSKNAEEIAYASVESQKAKEERKQIEEAHSKYTWVDPSSTDFDPARYELVRDRLASRMVDNKDASLVDVAAEIDNLTRPSMGAKSEKEIKREKQESTVAKAQAEEVSGNSVPRQPSTQEYDDLRVATMKGDKSALDARIKAALG